MKLYGMNSIFPLTCAGSGVCVCFSAHTSIIIFFRLKILWILLLHCL